MAGGVDELAGDVGVLELVRRLRLAIA